MHLIYLDDIDMMGNLQVVAMIRCEKCGLSVNDDAAACPGCGTPLKDSLPPSMSKPGARKKLLILLLAAVICVIAALVVVNWPTTPGETVLPATPAAHFDLNELRAKAEKGDPQSQKDLGGIYARGQGVKQSYSEAAKWYLKAAEQDHAGAQTALGELSEVGQGVKRDDSEAFKWYQKAADQGFAPAQYNLAVLYVMGKGVQPDTTAALKWYRLASEQGYALAQFNLGMRYYESKDVVADPVEAYTWLSLAVLQGIQDAAKVRDELKHRMSREQISEAQKRINTLSKKRIARPSE